MKNNLLMLLLIILIIIFIVVALLIDQNVRRVEAKRNNAKYEQYLGKEVYGTVVSTVISDALDNNEKNDIQKDKDGDYIDNKENSIKIDLKMITIDKTFSMEMIFKNDISKFMTNFNNIKFKCSNIEYHKKTGKVSKIVFEEMEL